MGTSCACHGAVPLRVLGVWLVLVVTTAPAAAAPGFVWTVPASCPDIDDVRARIERRLGAPLDLYGIEVAIEADEAGFVAHVDTRAVTVANQIRTLTSAHCDALVDAVAVVVARLASEWQRDERRQVRDDEEAIASIAKPLPATARPEVWGGGVRVLAVSGVGVVPQVGVGGEVAAYVRRGEMFTELAVARWADDSDYVADRTEGRAVSLELVGLRMGWSPSRMPLRAWLGAEVGTLTGSKVGLSAPYGEPWAALTTGFGVAWPMSEHARLVGTFEIAAVLARGWVGAADTGEIFRPSVWTARCAIGLELGWR